MCFSFLWGFHSAYGHRPTVTSLYANHANLSMTKTDLNLASEYYYLNDHLLPLAESVKKSNILIDAIRDRLQSSTVLRKPKRLDSGGINSFLRAIRDIRKSDGTLNKSEKNTCLKEFLSSYKQESSEAEEMWLWLWIKKISLFFRASLISYIVEVRELEVMFTDIEYNRNLDIAL